MPSTNTIYLARKSERGEGNSIHRELKNEPPKTPKWGAGTKNPPMTTHGIFLKNYEQALSSYQRMKFAEYRPLTKGLRDFKQFTTRKKLWAFFPLSKFLPDRFSFYLGHQMIKHEDIFFYSL